MTTVATLSETTSLPIFKSRRLGHANLWVSDYERAYDYYRNVIGFEHAYIQPDNKASFVSNGNTYHDYGLVDVRSPYAKPGQTPGLNHFAFELATEAELAEGYQRGKRAGLEFVAIHDHDVARAIYLRDPDGNEVEVYADVVPDWRSARRGVIEKKKPKYIPGESSPPIKDELFPKNPPISVVQDALFHPTKVSHVTLLTGNLGVMTQFYERVFGLSTFAASRRGEFVVLRGRVATCDLVLISSSSGSKVGLHHVGVQVEDEASLDEARNDIVSRGITLDSEIDHPARKALTIIAMDGVRTQFFVDRDWRADGLADLDRQSALALL